VRGGEGKGAEERETGGEESASRLLKIFRCPWHTVQVGGDSTLPVLQTPTASLLPHYTVYMNLAGTDPRGTHLPCPVFPEEKANYISWKATNYTNKQSSDQKPRIRL